MMSTTANSRGRGLPRRGGGRGRGGRSRPYPTSVGTRGLATTVAAVPNVEALVEERSATPTTIGRHFSEKKFADAPISNESKAGLKHEFLSDVQAATLDLALSGKDLLVQAKTGTGKTIAFLLPAIERLMKATRDKRQGISILVLSPTRELALQIEKEAETLLAHHTFSVQHAIGGTNQLTESKRLLNSPCDVLIATPGRLLDHLRSSSLPDRLLQLKTIVYDEADRLLDQGFKPELDSILGFLPPKHTRQALLFSATVSSDIKKVAAAALRPGYSFVSTLLEDETNTHEHVEQTYIITSQNDFIATAFAILQQDMRAHPGSSKCMVFFPTARQVAFAQELLSQLGNTLPPILEIHSRKSQSARIKAADAFKEAKSAVLLSSDVAARGMDFPGVTLVLQLGLPANGDQYIHRLGRTARAGAAGRGILVLSPSEKFFLQTPGMRDIPITLAPAPTVSPLPLDGVARESKEQAYRAWLGYYNGHSRAMGMKNKEELVQAALEYAVGALGWPEGELPPSLEPKTVGNMGLRGVKGLNIERRPSGPKRGGGGGGPGRGGGVGRRGGVNGAGGVARRGGIDGAGRS